MQDKSFLANQLSAAFLLGVEHGDETPYITSRQLLDWLDIEENNLAFAFQAAYRAGRQYARRYNKEYETHERPGCVCATL